MEVPGVEGGVNCGERRDGGGGSLEAVSGGGVEGEDVGEWVVLCEGSVVLGLEVGAAERVSASSMSASASASSAVEERGAFARGE